MKWRDLEKHLKNATSNSITLLLMKIRSIGTLTTGGTGQVFHIQLFLDFFTLYLMSCLQTTFVGSGQDMIVC